VVGYGIVDAKGSRVIPVTFGVLRAKMDGEYTERLRSIYVGLAALLQEHKPDVVAIEEAFYGKNAAAALRMGEGRGVAILAAAVAERPLHQYAPAQVKMSVVGNGRAHKSQIQEMVRMILGLPRIPEPEDAADALAVAICHCNHLGSAGAALGIRV
jgi:crossover junction endodeoxyribonuclease RuvC